MTSKITTSARPQPPAGLRPSNRLIEKYWNTYVRLPLPWRGRPDSHRIWENQELGDALGPDKFVELQDSSELLVEEIASQVSSDSAPILDLGCNVGRHLNALWKRGLSNLHGVDVQRSAIVQMSASFPELRASVTQATFQQYLPVVKSGAFEIVFTHGATVELVPPYFPLASHVARVTRQAIIFVINENGHSYPRLWETEFARHNFLLTKLLRPIHSGTGLSLMVFSRVKSVK